MGAVFSPHMHLKTGTDRSRHVSFKTEFPWPLPSCLQCFDAVGWAAGRASGL